MFIENVDELKRAGVVGQTEIKFENSITRTTALANPRQIERVVRGAKFPMQLKYEVTSEEEMLQDFKILKDGFQLLEYDYLGGSGSRRYGRIKISDIELCVVIGDVSDDVLDECQEILNGERE